MTLRQKSSIKQHLGSPEGGVITYFPCFVSSVVQKSAKTLLTYYCMFFKLFNTYIFIEEIIIRLCRYMTFNFAFK